jgi:hypothetical protein
MPAWDRRGPCSTVLSKEEEALAVAFRNVLCALQATVRHLTRSHRRTAQMVRLPSHTVLQYEQSVEQSEGNGRTQTAIDADGNSAGRWDPLAPRGIPSLLALQIETTREPSKLGIDVGQSTAAKYMAKRKRPPSQGWRAFLRNYADGVASMDLTVGARCPVVSFWMSNSTDVRTDFDIL